MDQNTTRRYTLHPTPDTRHPTLYILHPTPYTPHLTPYTLHPQLSTPHGQVGKHLKQALSVTGNKLSTYTHGPKHRQAVPRI